MRRASLMARILGIAAVAVCGVGLWQTSAGAAGCPQGCCEDGRCRHGAGLHGQGGSVAGRGAMAGCRQCGADGCGPQGCGRRDGCQSACGKQNCGKDRCCQDHCCGAGCGHHCCKHDVYEKRYFLRSQGKSWHSAWYDPWEGRPIALVVPPTAEFQTQYSWGVPSSRVMPIYHQFRRPYPGPGGVAGGGGRLLPTPNQPSDTVQFGVNAVRGPWGAY
jgi:hypothetical protein